MTGTKVLIPIYVDLYLTEDGAGIYVSTESDGFQEKIVSFNDLMKDYLSMYHVPSDPPTMHDEDREKILTLINNLLSAIDYLRKLEHDTPTWNKNRMGHRD